MAKRKTKEVSADSVETPAEELTPLDAETNALKPETNTSNPLWSLSLLEIVGLWEELHTNNITPKEAKLLRVIKSQK